MREKNKFLSRTRFLFPMILAIAISGCGKGSAYILPPQLWNDTEFLVEIRPGAPRKGMNEFVVISTQTDGAPGYNYIINIKTNSAEKTSQMIQDGHSGVYRRAIEVKDPVNDVLIVQIIHATDSAVKTELHYPLSKHL